MAAWVRSNQVIVVIKSYQKAGRREAQSLPWQPLLAAAASVVRSTPVLVCYGFSKRKLNTDLRQRRAFRSPIRTDVPAKLNADLR